MNDFCNELNIDISPLYEGYDITTQILSHVSISLDYINPKLVNFLSQHGLKTVLLECFKRGPGNKSTIHTDSFTANGNLIKINWIYGGKNSFMSWYSPKGPDSGIRRHTIADTPFIAYSPNEVNLIATYTTLNKPYLVQVGVPHSIINPEETRYCISCVLGKSSGDKLTMNDAKNLLAQYINSN